MGPSARALAITSLAPISWGTTYVVTTELLPPDRPVFTGLVRALPSGIALTLIGRGRPEGPRVRSDRLRTRRRPESSSSGPDCDASRLTKS